MKKIRKGQVEAVFVLILVIIGITAFFVLFRGESQKDESMRVSSASSEKATIKDAVINLMRKGISEEIKRLYAQGGVFSPSENSITLGKYRVEVLYDGKTKRPLRFKEELENALEAYIKKHLKDEMDFYGKKVLFDIDNLEISVSILKRRIAARAKIPTKIEGIDSENVYEAEVSSDLYDIIKVAEDIVKFESENMFFAENVMDAAIRSEEGTVYWIPVIGMVTGCENSIFMNKKTAKSRIENLIRFATSRTVLSSRKEGFYYMPVSSRSLPVYFSYPPWDMGEHMKMEPDPVRVVPTRPFPFSSVCIAQYAVSYSFSFPVIAYIKDELLGEWFRFVMIANIKDNMPSKDIVKTSGEGNYYLLCEKNAYCPVDIEVRFEDGSHADGAKAYFDKCFIGESDSSGHIRGSAPCFVGELYVGAAGGRVYREFLKADDLNGKKITLKKSGKVSIMFNAVPLLPVNRKSYIGTYERYEVVSKPVKLGSMPDKYIVFLYLMKVSSPFSMEYFVWNNVNGDGLSDEKVYERIHGKYRIIGIATDIETGHSVGYFSSEYEFGGDEKEIIINIPIASENYPSKTTPQLDVYPDEIIKMMAALSDSGIEPLEVR